MSAALEIGAVVDRRRIVLCCGSGGVGKTTTAAAIGLLAARRGRSVLVITIDPARRLAQAMGLDALRHEPQQVPVDGIDNGGSLSAMMLDPRHAFDHLVEKYAPDTRTREKIFANRFYQQLSTSLAGSREFMAMEQLNELSEDDRFDLIVVDTPPSQHALDFIDAPRRLFALFDGAFVRMLVEPGRRGLGLFKRPADAVLKVLERFTGSGFLTDLADFFSAFSSMFGGFRQRSARLRSLLASDDCGFVLVCTPEPASLAEAAKFCTRLARESMNVDGVVANRCHLAPATGRVTLKALRAELQSIKPPTDDEIDGELLAERLVAAWHERQQLATADEAALARMPDSVTAPVRRVPRFDHDLHSLDDLDRVARALQNNSGNDA